MFGVEKKLFEQLCYLKDEYRLKGIKAEFEAEGSSFRDLMRLRRLTSRAGISLYLKIGGVEAVRDIKDAAEINVDGLIAPMTESPFGALKFIEAVSKVYGSELPHMTLNLETQGAVENVDDILKISSGCVDNITIGRTDLSGSYFDDAVKPDSDFILTLLEGLGEKVQSAGMTMTVGGSVSAKTVQAISDRPQLAALIYKLETRKVILETDMMLNKKDAIREALKFEELYILSKKEFSDMNIASEIKRLTDLKGRING